MTGSPQFPQLAALRHRAHRCARHGARALGRRVGREEDGAVIVIVAIAMTVVLGMAALVVDIGAVEVRKAQLQDAADAAATAIAQQCFEASGTTVNFCDPGVTSVAAATALRYAQDTLPNSGVSVTAVTFTGNTVKVSLASDQDATFARIFSVTSTHVVTSATAQWGLPAVPLPLAYNECALPAPSSTTKEFLRYDLLDLSFGGCGLIGGVTDLLGPGWLTSSDCSWSVDLLSYVSATLTKVLPTQCAATVSTLVGKYVLLPVYSHVLTDIVINGVLLGQGYAVQKYALVQVTGYDFQPLNALGVPLLGGMADISGDPQCPTVLGLLKVPTCQGLQGYLQGYLTPSEAAARMRGVQLIA